MPVPSVSLRTRLALVVVLALLPALTLIVILRSTLSQDGIEEADERVRVAAQLVADAQLAREEGARQMLAGIARAVAVIGADSPGCADLLRDAGADAASLFIARAGGPHRGGPREHPAGAHRGRAGERPHP